MGAQTPTGPTAPARAPVSAPTAPIAPPVALGGGGGVGSGIGAVDMEPKASPALAGLQAMQGGPEPAIEGQMLSGPSLGRQNIGQRIPPSLVALLRPKVY